MVIVADCDARRGTRPGRLHRTERCCQLRSVAAGTVCGGRRHRACDWRDSAALVVGSRSYRLRRSRRLSDFDDGQSISRAPDGSTLNLAQLTIRRQAESDAMYPTAPDRPVWQLFAHALVEPHGAWRGQRFTVRGRVDCRRSRRTRRESCRRQERHRHDARRGICRSRRQTRDRGRRSIVNRRWRPACLASCGAMFRSWRGTKFVEARSIAMRRRSARYGVEKDRLE